MSLKEEDKDWITVFPDYPDAFAWHRKACREDELDDGLGASCDSWYSPTAAYILKDAVPADLSRELKSWHSAWQNFDPASGDRAEDWDEERRIDKLGIELTKKLKECLGGKYRFRYSRCYSYGENPYPADESPFRGKSWIIV